MPGSVAPVPYIAPCARNTEYANAVQLFSARADVYFKDHY